MDQRRKSLCYTRRAVAEFTRGGVSRKDGHLCERFWFVGCSIIMLNIVANRPTEWVPYARATIRITGKS